jgi:hypothetical protein
VTHLSGQYGTPLVLPWRHDLGGTAVSFRSANEHLHHSDAGRHLYRRLRAGVKFQSTVAGHLIGLRYFRPANENSNTALDYTASALSTSVTNGSLSMVAVGARLPPSKHPPIRPSCSPPATGSSLPRGRRRGKALPPSAVACYTAGKATVLCMRNLFERWNRPARPWSGGIQALSALLEALAEGVTARQWSIARACSWKL